MDSLPPEFTNKAKQVLGPKGWIVNDADAAPFLREWRDRWHGQTRFIALPKNCDEAAKIIQLCTQFDLCITTQGGNTGLVGGQIPKGEILLSTKRMLAIREYNPQAKTITIEAGISLDALNEIAAADNLMVAVDLASSGSASVGGTISTNAGGMGVLRYGSMRAQVLGLEVILADGQIWSNLTGLHKDNTGYDLKHAFIGAEGTLGMIGAACLKLVPIPQKSMRAWVSLGSISDGLELLKNLTAIAGNQVSKFELISDFALTLVLDKMSNAKPPLNGTSPWHILIETDQFDLSDFLQNSLLAGLIQDAVLAQTNGQADALLALRENISAAQKGQGLAIKHDIALPLSKIEAFCKIAGQQINQQWPLAKICAFGHLGDGNLHYNILLPNPKGTTEPEQLRKDISRLVYDLIAEFGGSFSAEHGIGIAKKAEIMRYKSEQEIALMGAIKQALDPQNRMNPRVLFPDRIPIR